MDAPTEDNKSQAATRVPPVATRSSITRTLAPSCYYYFKERRKRERKKEREKERKKERKKGKRERGKREACLRDSK
jgi:hypothetical protein